MTRLLTLAALGLAIALAPTPGEAQVPDYFHLLDQDQDGDFYLTRRDFEQSPEIKQPMKACTKRIMESSNFKKLPGEDQDNLRKLNNLASDGKKGRVVALGEVCARNDFLRRNPNLKGKLEPDGC